MLEKSGRDKNATKDDPLRARTLSMRLSALLSREPQTDLERKLRSLETRWRAGDLTALDEAIRACWVRHPEARLAQAWLVEAIGWLGALAMTEEERRSRREWVIHCTRWVTLRKLRPGDRGTSWERAREEASEELEETDAAGSAATVKRSYELIEAAGGEDATFESYKEARRRRRGKPG
jgi:hypothetical protein